MRLLVELLEFLVERGQLGLEVLVAQRFAGFDAHIAAGVEGPALGLDFRQRGGLAEPGYVGIGHALPEDFPEFAFGLFPSERKVGCLAPVEADNIREKTYLRFRPLAVGAVDLAVDVAGVDEEDGAGPDGLRFSPVQEPERAGQRHSVEHVGAHGDHRVHGPTLDELPADVGLRVARVRRGVGHDETRAAPFVQRRVEELYPEIVGVVRPGQPEWIAPALAHGVLDSLLVYGVDVERWIGEHKVEAARGAVGIVVVAVHVAAVPYVALEPVHGQIHAAETPGFFGFLDTID